MEANNIVLSSLAMDLKRIAIGLHRGSTNMANRFTEEALKRKNEILISSLKPYMQNIMLSLDSILLSSDSEQKSEYALMYSTLIQNYVIVNIRGKNER